MAQVKKDILKIISSNIQHNKIIYKKISNLITNQGKKMFKNIHFSQELDDFLNREIGYDNLGVITSNLFLSPYACTDLREYFANGFEHYFRSSPEEVKTVSPVLYRKVLSLLRGEYL